MSQISQIGLNIHLLSFAIPREGIKDNDDIRVSITTFPENIKQHFNLHAKKIYNCNHIFTINITKETQKILMTFRKKCYVDGDPIISSSLINTSNLPKIPDNFDQISNIVCSEVKTFNLYQPVRKQTSDELGNSHSDSKVAKMNGSMQVQFTLTSPFALSEKEKSHKNSKNKDNRKASKDYIEQKHHKNNKISKHYKNKCINDYILI